MNKGANPIWKPSAHAIEHANMTHFLKAVNNHHNLSLSSYEDLHQWSLLNLQDFYRLLWDFCDLKASHKGKQEILVTPELFKSIFFEDATLNYAENLLRDRPLDTPALIFWG